VNKQNHNAQTHEQEEFAVLSEEYIHIMRPIIMHFSPASHYFPALRSILLSTLFSNTLNAYSFLRVKTKFHSHAKQEVKL
jgi:hypothetical protein